MRKRSPAEVKRLVATHPVKSRDTFPTSAHHIHDYLRLVSALGGNPEPLQPELRVGPNEISAFRNKWKLQKATSKIIGVNPGAEYGPAKRWPVDRFVEVLESLAKTHRPTVLIFGGNADRQLASRIESAFTDKSATILNLAGRTSLRELIAGISICDLLLTNDTGPMHLAAAVQTSVIVPFGSTSPELTGPGMPGASGDYLLLGQAPCAPCFLRECPIDFRCMKSIESRDVIKAASAALA